MGDASHQRLAILTQIQKSLRGIFNAQKSLREVLVGSEALVSGVVNLCHQYQCCERCEDKELPILAQPRHGQLRQKLRVKMAAVCEGKRLELAEIYVDVSRHVTTIINQCNVCRSVYEKHKHAVGVEGVVKRSPTTHSISDMMLMLEDIGREYHTHHHLLRMSVQRLVPGEEESVRGLEEAWALPQPLTHSKPQPSQPNHPKPQPSQPNHPKPQPSQPNHLKPQPTQPNHLKPQPNHPKHWMDVVDRAQDLLYLFCQEKLTTHWHEQEN